MEIEFDAAKRDITLQERGLDLADAGQIFSGIHATRTDNRKDYGEPRFQTFGFLYGHAAVVVWTPRGQVRRIISLRYAHEHEAKAFGLG
ncbi:MAG: BrnT family toxin [Pseudoxanthomonas sp.]